MKIISTLAAAALIAASATVALAQGGTSASGGTSAAGADPGTPRQNMTRPTPNSPPVNRRSDEMAPMQGSNVSNTMVVKKKKHRTTR